jgi:hypothetical protein
VHRAPGIPCALCFLWGGWFLQQLGRKSRRGIAELCFSGVLLEKLHREL